MCRETHSGLILAEERRGQTGIQDSQLGLDGERDRSYDESSYIVLAGVTYWLDKQRR